MPSMYVNVPRLEQETKNTLVAKLYDAAAPVLKAPHIYTFVNEYETCLLYTSPADSDITVVKVVSAQLYINSMDEIKHNAEKAQPELTAVADMLPGYQVKTQVLLGSAPGVEIVEYAKESGTEMIIMTRSSRGPLRKLGSVATYIVRNASFLDVIVMREEGDE